MRNAKVLLGLAFLLSSTASFAATEIVSVDSHSGPWSTLLNPGLDYGTHDEAAPAAVAAGFSFAAGGLFTITYLDGLTSPYGGTPYADGLGDTGYLANDSGGSSGLGFPSIHIDPSFYPAYLNELVGAFADASGVVVGNPFLIGDGTTIAAPVGAFQLLLGYNDDIFSDNSGSLRVEVSGPDASVVPEPASWALMVGGFGLTGAALRRRRQVQVSFG